MIFKKTIIFDFDGTITEYKNGWQGATVIDEKPVKGIKELIEKLRQEYSVVVYSTRCHEPGGKEAIEKWLKNNEIIVDQVVLTKVPAYVSIDDRAITFDGKCNAIYDKIKNFKPWNN
jgi:beta-phosphoglucomutase-like phosphatase (HAD superfamily)